MVSQTQPILFQNLFKQVIHRHCSLCHPQPTWAGKGWNPIKLHPNPHKAPSPNPQGCSGNSSRWQLSSSPARTSLFAPPGPVFTCISAEAAAASPHSPLRPLAETLLAPDSCNAAQGKASRALGAGCEDAAELYQQVQLTPCDSCSLQNTSLLLWGRWGVPSSGDKALLMAHSRKCCTQSNFYPAQTTQNPSKVAWC